MSTAFLAVKGFALSSLIDHITERVDRAGNTLPANSQSVDDLVAWVDRVGESTLRDILDWQPTLAVVIQMPKRSRRRAKR
jgi:hypothetical protein